jgi:hypothetical protein
MIDSFEIEFGSMTTECVKSIAEKSLAALVGFAEGDAEHSAEAGAKSQAVDDLARLRAYKEALKIIQEVSPR